MGKLLAYTSGSVHVSVTVTGTSVGSSPTVTVTRCAPGGVSLGAVIRTAAVTP